MPASGCNFNSAQPFLTCCFCCITAYPGLTEQIVQAIWQFGVVRGYQYNPNPGAPTSLELAVIQLDNPA